MGPAAVQTPEARQGRPAARARGQGHRRRRSRPRRWSSSATRTRKPRPGSSWHASCGRSPASPDRAERDKVRRLASMLARKGYQPSQAFRIVREVLDAAVGRCRDGTGSPSPRQLAEPVPLAGEFDHSLPSSGARTVRGTHSRRRAPSRWRRCRAPHLPGAHLRLPDERPRLRADRRACSRPRVRPAPPVSRPTSWCSTPARSGRTPTTSSTATSGTWLRSRQPTRACRSPSAAAWPRRTGRPS